MKPLASSARLMHKRAIYHQTMESARVNVVLPKKMYASVNKLVELGYYKSFSEAVRTGLRDEMLKYEVPMANLSDSEVKEINEGFADIGAGRTTTAEKLAKEFGYEL